MKKLLMLLIVLALSLPAYAVDPDILVYKITMTGRQFDPEGIEKQKVRGYLVVAVDASEMSNLQNGETLWYVDDRLIFYGKEGRQKLQWTPEPGRVETTWTYFQPGKKKGTMYLTLILENEQDSAAYGRVRRTLIGTGKPKPRIPTKLKGYGRTYYDFAFCSLFRQTIKLDSKRTKNANKENKTVDQVVQELENRLRRKGYEQLTPP
jgi:hypothetical protein